MDAHLSHPSGLLQLLYLCTNYIQCGYSIRVCSSRIFLQIEGKSNQQWIRRDVNVFKMYSDAQQKRKKLQSILFLHNNLCLFSSFLLDPLLNHTLPYSFRNYWILLGRSLQHACLQWSHGHYKGRWAKSRYAFHSIYVLRKHFRWHRLNHNWSSLKRKERLLQINQPLHRPSFYLWFH